jgi:hypothetical protein
MPFDINNVNLLNPDVLRWKSYVLHSTRAIHLEFKRSRGLILTEGDLQCLLYNHLYSSHLELRTPFNTMNFGGQTIKLHSEVTWFKADKKSGFVVDLTLSNPQNMDLNNVNQIANFPYKGFFHDGEALGVELKFIRDNSFKDSVEEDLDIIIKEIFPAKYARMHDGTYNIANLNNIGFTVIIGCKNDNIFNYADHYLQEYIHANKIRDYNFLEIILFSPNNFKTKLEYEA